MKLIFINICIALLVLTSCNSTKKKNSKNNSNTIEKTIDSHTSENALDWAGTYKGVLPCADCEGIETAITLNNDLTYTIKEVYLGKNDSPFESKGTFEWSKDGQKITLSDTDKNSYFVGENNLTQLDKSGNKITGDLAHAYVLKSRMKTLTDVKWKLITLRGRDISDNKAFITFNSEGNKVHGNSGCNSFSGTYEVTGGNQISFSKMAVTRMACPDMTVEDQFLEILNTTDNFSLNDDGSTMTLNKAKMMPLAVFEAL